tara:strand:+ start:58 stop:273 length:216 start_codon:yes stop_codon:yes gene_type:complete
LHCPEIWAIIGHTTKQIIQMKCFAEPTEYTFYLPDEDREINLICDNLEDAEALLPTGLFAMLMAVDGDSRF